MSPNQARRELELFTNLKYRRITLKNQENMWYKKSSLIFLSVKAVMIIRKIHNTCVIISQHFRYWPLWILMFLWGWTRFNINKSYIYNFMWVSKQFMLWKFEQKENCYQFVFSIKHWDNIKWTCAIIAPFKQGSILPFIILLNEFKNFF